MDLLADKLIPAADGFDRDAMLLLLAYAASSAGQEIPLEPIAEALTHLGWRQRDGRPLDGYELYRLAAFDTLINVSEKTADLGGADRSVPWLLRSHARLCVADGVTYLSRSRRSRR